MRRVALPIASLLLIVASLFAVGLHYPELIVEDGLIESGSALFFIAAATIALIRVALIGGLLPRDRFVLVLTVPLAVLLALSEVSFGARLGMVSPPSMYGGGEFDGGHDVVILVVRLLRDNPGLAVPIGLAVLAASSAIGMVLWRHRLRLVRLAVAYSTPFNQRFALAIAILFAALILDLVPSWKAGILEEVMEFTASLTLLTMALTSRKPAAASANQNVRIVGAGQPSVRSDARPSFRDRQADSHRVHGRLRS